MAQEQIQEPRYVVVEHDDRADVGVEVEGGVEIALRVSGLNKDTIAKAEDLVERLSGRRPHQTGDGLYAVIRGDGQRRMIAQQVGDRLVEVGEVAVVIGAPYPTNTAAVRAEVRAQALRLALNPSTEVRVPLDQV